MRGKPRRAVGLDRVRVQDVVFQERRQEQQAQQSEDHRRHAREQAHDRLDDPSDLRRCEDRDEQALPIANGTPINKAPAVVRMVPTIPASALSCVYGCPLMPV